MKRVLIVLFVTIVWNSLFAQTGGKIAGRVIDASNGDALIGANVLLVGMKMGANTDLDGNFIVTKIPVGTYSVQISYIGYSPKLITNVNVTEGLVTTLKVSLESESLQGEEVVVEAKIDRTAAAALLVEQKKSALVSDAIGNEQISKTPDKSAGETLKRVTGITVVGNKYVYVRGLGERYSNAQLNNVDLPSPEPEKKVIPMDIFPSASIQNIAIIKTYNPDMPAEFSGGLVKISTKEFPEQFYANVSVSSGLNRASFNKIPSYGGSGTGSDFLGFDDGKRARPNVPRFNIATPNDQKAAYAAQFQNSWLPQNKDVGPNGGFSLSIGNSLDYGIPVGYLASLTYSLDFNTRKEKEFYPIADGTPAYDYDTRKGSYSVLWGALVDLNAKLTPNNKVGFKTVFNVQTEDETNEAYGFINASTSGNVRATRLRFVERTLQSYQLYGEHQVPEMMNSKVEWRGAYSTAFRDEPDTRQTFYFLNNGTYEAASSSKNGRFFSELDDRESSFGLDWTIPMPVVNKSTKLKFGGLARNKERAFDAFRYSYANVDESVKALSPEQLFTPDHISNGLLTFFDDTQPNDAYDANEQVFAGYAMTDYLIAPKWRLVGGMRFEHYHVELSSKDLNGKTAAGLSPDRTVNELFPAMNLVYSLNETMNFRVGYSQTKARPQFRELAPFRYDDYRRSTFGNPFLKSTDIYNYDFRWEFFPRPGELFAISTFYKKFINPIERFLLPTGSSQSGDPEPVNGGNANNYGIELEARKSLDEIGETFKHFSVSTNVSFIHSRVTQKKAIAIYTAGQSTPIYFSPELLANQSRPMVGQSPFIVNVSLNYANPSTKTDANLAYNVSGERISEISQKSIDAEGNKIYDDIYEQPFHQLDLTVSQKLTTNLKVKVNFKNLLGDDVSFKMGRYTTNRYEPGRSFSTTLSYDF